ncbi:O-antigen ligase family protein, partial [Acinetobacter baumannii]
MLKKIILFLLVAIYLITAILGYQTGWSIFQYDELRLLQFPLALYALLILIFAKKLKFSIYSQITFFIIAGLILTQQINWEIFEFQELWSVIALLFI